MGPAEEMTERGGKNSGKKQMNRVKEMFAVNASMTFLLMYTERYVF